jgi:hypothetical protein
LAGDADHGFVVVWEAFVVSGAAAAVVGDPSHSVVRKVRVLEAGAQILNEDGSEYSSPDHTRRSRSDPQGDTSRERRQEHWYSFRRRGLVLPCHLNPDHQVPHGFCVTPAPANTAHARGIRRSNVNTAADRSS